MIAGLASLLFLISLSCYVTAQPAPICAVCQQVIVGVDNAHPADRVMFDAAVKASCNEVATYRPVLADRVCFRLLSAPPYSLYAAYRRNGGVLYPLNLCTSLEFC
ncbi:hypothetical protein AAVH_25461 [Aphelenchoides avenae]|nr:hypothetical protein AAVH_25461 [Aphelenchus avenae]